jgi:hypothetical protein
MHYDRLTSTPAVPFAQILLKSRTLRWQENLAPASIAADTSIMPLTLWPRGRVGRTSFLGLSRSRRRGSCRVQRVAGIRVPKPDSVGIGGVNALEDIGMNAGALVDEALDEIGGLCEHLRPFQLVIAIIGAISARHKLYRWSSEPFFRIARMPHGLRAGSLPPPHVGTRRPLCANSRHSQTASQALPRSAASATLKRTTMTVIQPRTSFLRLSTRDSGARLVSAKGGHGRA